jgi:extradiol dioxygenase family protein
MPVDDLAAARTFYGDVLGLDQGRSSITWIDWNLHGHQFVTHLAPERPQRIHNPVDGHDVPVPHFGLILTVPEFQKLAERPMSGSKGRPANSGRCSRWTRQATRWSSKRSPTTRRSSPPEPS